MSGQATAREKFNFFNDLTCLLKAIEGKYTTIDLRNDSFVTGKLSNVDGFMNVTMDDVIFNNGRGEEYYFDNFFIHSRNIRYVHIPETMSIIDTIKEQVTWKPREKPTKQTMKPLKVKRAVQRHLETVASIEESQEGA